VGEEIGNISRSDALDTKGTLQSGFAIKESSFLFDITFSLQNKLMLMSSNLLEGNEICRHRGYCSAPLRINFVSL
jgi:hypothetical protein